MIPLPPKLRRKPKQSDHPADGAAFEQDCAAWAAEKVERTRLLKERKGGLDKARDRSKRKRGTDSTGVSDSTRRVKARQESEVQQSSHKESESARRKEKRQGSEAMQQQQAYIAGVRARLALATGAQSRCVGWAP